MSEHGPEQPISQASAHLRDLARRITAAYVAHTPTRAVLLTGSAAAGESDGYSDIDLIVYYDEPPSHAQREAARARVITELDAEPLSRPYGDWYRVGGVLCQVARFTLALSWDRQLDRALGPDFVEGDQKALSGLLHGVALHGRDIIAERRERVATYPAALARATVERYLQVQATWRWPEYFVARDASLWFHQAAVDGCLQVLGVLAGLNRQYYSTFQFKRLRAFAATLHVKPPELADRIERLLARITGDPPAAARDLEALVAQTVALVEEHMPEVDISNAKRDLGERQRPWQLPSEPTHES